MSLSTVTAFVGKRRVASGLLADVARSAFATAGAEEAVLIFDDETGRVVDFDPRETGEPAANSQLASMAGEPVQGREEASAPRKPGRPRLGVVAREVTLLPRHWDWLAAQPGGASVALRKLVEAARKDRPQEERRRRSREAAYRFMSAMAGDEPGFEEANRALFAGAVDRFADSTASWPADIAAHARRLASPAFEGE